MFLGKNRPKSVIPLRAITHCYFLSYQIDEKQRWELYKALESEREVERKRFQEASQYNNNRLEKFIMDKEYRNELFEYSDRQLCVEYYEYQHLNEFEKKLKEKLNLPSNANIRYDKVKCSKDCRHDHKYFYAYYWDNVERRLKKKYIGKKLPETI